MGEQRIEVASIGRAESPLTDPAAAPNQGDEGAPEASIVFETGVLPALEGVQPGDELIVLTWLDGGRRDILRVHPRGDVTRPERGVFVRAHPTGPTRSVFIGSRS